MAPIRQMQNILPGLRWHHERWQGGGYPDNLQGEQIPLMARIIACWASWTSCTSLRCFLLNFPLTGNVRVTSAT
ncbi:MAG: HD domain-containing phosphohydrolase [Planctomycetota bacterium]